MSGRLSCRMYANKFPEVDDLVMVNVRQIAEMGAYVQLLEYDNIEGMILLSELSRRRIRSIQKLIRVGKNEVVVVLRVDKEKGTFSSPVSCSCRDGGLQESLLFALFSGTEKAGSTKPRIDSPPAVKSAISLGSLLYESQQFPRNTQLAGKEKGTPDPFVCQPRSHGWLCFYYSWSA